MKILTDQYGYVISFATLGELVDGFEVPEPEDLQHFIEHHQSYKLADGVLIFNESQADTLAKKQAKDEYRRLREKECFPVINRGQLWYEKLSDAQLQELREWYRAWLDSTEKLTIPKKPKWL